MEDSLLLNAGKIIGSLGAILGVLKAFGRFVLKPVKTHFAKFDEIYAEFKPNGGGSIKDAVTKIEASVSKIESWQKTRLNHEGTMFFDADAEGAITWVNKETAKQLKGTEAELMGYGYRNFISPQDRARVADEITEAAAAEIDLKTFFTATDGRCFCCELLIVRFNKTIAGYTGVLTVRNSRSCQSDA